MNMQAQNDESLARKHETFDTSNSFLNMKNETEQLPANWQMVDT